MAFSERQQCHLVLYHILLLLLISSHLYVYAQESACPPNSTSKFDVVMCENDCSHFSMPTTKHVISVRDRVSVGDGCGLSIQTQPGYGFILSVGYMNIDACEGACGTSNYINFRDNAVAPGDYCECGKAIPGNTHLFSTDQSTVTVAYQGAEFILTVQVSGCLTSDLITGNRAQFEYTDGSPKTGESFSVRVTCPEGFLLDKKYHYVDNRCEVPFGSVGMDKRGSWEKPSVGCKKVKCEPPSAPANGSFSPQIEELYKFNEEINYECDSGYDLVGPTTRKCTSSHGVGPHFSGDSPTCIQKDCGPPAEIENGNRYGGSDTLYSATRLADCKRGYEIHGNQSITCQGDGTWSNPPTCEIIECPEPPTVPHSTYYLQARGSVEGKPRAFGSHWVFSCVSGFRLTGDTIMDCRLDGTWSPPPTCTAENCDVVGLPAHPHYHCVDCDTNMGTRVNHTRTYTCIEGYVEKIETSICRNDGTWSTLSGCRPVSSEEGINCGVPDEIAHGEWQYPSTLYGDKANLSCNLGYMLDDKENVLTCSETGIWANGPRCKEVDCGMPPKGNNLVMSVPFTTNYNSKISFDCVEGYYMDSSKDFINCDKSGQWTDPPTCTIKDCGPPDELRIENGTYNQTYNTVYNSVISYKCNYGFMFLKEDSSICLANGSWSNLPECVVIDCELPSNISSARMVSNNGTGWGDLVTYQCLTSEVPMMVSGECTEDGTWSYPACPQKKNGAMIYVYIGCAVGILLIVLTVVLLVGLCFRKKEQSLREKEMALSERPKKKTDGSQCSNDSGMGVDGEQLESDHPASLNNYDCKSPNAALLTTTRLEGSPEAQYSTNSLNRPRSRLPIGIMNADDLDEDIKNPLYGEQRIGRVGSKNASPCNVRESPEASVGVGSPLLNNFNAKEWDDNHSARKFNTLTSHSRQGNIVESYPAHSMDRYHPSPKVPRVIPGKELNQTQTYPHTADSQDDYTYSTQTLPVHRQYNDVPSVYM